MGPGDPKKVSGCPGPRRLRRGRHCLLLGLFFARHSCLEGGQGARQFYSGSSWRHRSLKGLVCRLQIGTRFPLSSFGRGVRPSCGLGAPFGFLGCTRWHTRSTRADRSAIVTSAGGAIFMGSYEATLLVAFEAALKKVA